MLEIVIPGTELFDPVTETFTITNEVKLQLEHSLYALAKWESKWCIPFLGNDKITREQNADYVRCMTLTEGVDPSVYLGLTDQNLQDIANYLEAPMTATKINDTASKANTSGSYVTSERIYYWMAALRIPFECQYWHLNRLLTLIRVAEIEQRPPKKMGRREAMQQQKSLNAARRAKHRSRG